MTAYIHIGTPKTGTTSIQKFITLNLDLFLQQGMVYPKTFCVNNQHAKIAYIIKNMKSDFNFWLNQEVVFLRNEISENKKYTFLFSSEMISLYINESYTLIRLKELFNWLGFKNIKCILYLRSNDEYMISHSSQNIKCGLGVYYKRKAEFCTSMGMHMYKTICKNYINVFGKENIIVRLFDKNEFYQGDLLKDFIHSIGLEWDNKFRIPERENETLDLIGFELQGRLNKLGCGWNNKINSTMEFSEKYFTSKDPHLKFQPAKEVTQSYMDYFEESNEWVRKEFFPHKERLFPKKDLTNYKENYELKEMKPEYWDRIAEFIADIVKTKNQAIQNKDNQIATINNEKQKLIDEKLNLQIQINQLQNTLNTLPIKKQQLEISNLEQDLINKKLNAKETNQNILIKELEIKKLEQELNINQAFSYIPKEQSAKQRIQNQLSYKLGQAMIINSKSILGYIRMPFVLSYIKDKHKQEQKIYQEKIKKDPSLKLPPLENYPDYKEALKEKECLTYKLGEALIRANNNWYGGGYIKLWFEIRKLKREFRKKANHA
ncbi:TPA: hypothetical protein ACSPVW_000009 [Campylobacter coli]|uniref:hypothetical protein n=8 Tax=Campylobacter coli TaxID=195 RepID=UPI001F3DB614|nr:hypothetical protein [Campylobacter coli]MDP8519478.1 hypothetical protein [Campylobacter coli]WFC17512.1 hypothetical protein L4420_01775 [Campylobacter coli]